MRRFLLILNCLLSFLYSLLLNIPLRGDKKNGLQAFPGAQVDAMFPQEATVPTYPTYLYADFKSEAKFDYLLVAVLAKFGWSLKPKSPFRIYVDAGPFLGFLLSAKQVTTGSSIIYGDPGGQQPLSQNSEVILRPSFIPPILVLKRMRA
jgi:hypothetical protein